MSDHDDEGWPDWEINSLRDKVADLEVEIDNLSRENQDLRQSLQESIEEVQILCDRNEELLEDSWKYNDLL
jgi:regulator of replication initiation timing